MINADSLGIRSMVYSLNERFGVADRLKRVFQYFDLHSRIEEIHRSGHNLKIEIGNRAAGKPLVDQYEITKKVAVEMINQTKYIIVIISNKRKQRRRRTSLNIDHTNIFLLPSIRLTRFLIIY